MEFTQHSSIYTIGNEIFIDEFFIDDDLKCFFDFADWLKEQKLKNKDIVLYSTSTTILLCAFVLTFFVRPRAQLINYNSNFYYYRQPGVVHCIPFAAMSTSRSSISVTSGQNVAPAQTQVNASKPEIEDLPDENVATAQTQVNAEHDQGIMDSQESFKSFKRDLRNLSSKDKKWVDTVNESFENIMKDKLSNHLIDFHFQATDVGHYIPLPVISNSHVPSVPSTNSLVEQPEVNATQQPEVNAIQQPEVNAIQQPEVNAIQQPEVHVTQQDKGQKWQKTLEKLLRDSSIRNKSGDYKKMRKMESEDGD